MHVPVTVIVRVPGDRRAYPESSYNYKPLKLVCNQVGEESKVRGHAVERVVLQGLKQSDLHPEVATMLACCHMSLRAQGIEPIYLEVEPEV